MPERLYMCIDIDTTELSEDCGWYGLESDEDLDSRTIDFLTCPDCQGPVSVMSIEDNRNPEDVLREKYGESHPQLS